MTVAGARRARAGAARRAAGRRGRRGRERGVARAVRRSGAAQGGRGAARRAARRRERRSRRPTGTPTPGPARAWPRRSRATTTWWSSTIPAPLGLAPWLEGRSVVWHCHVNASAAGGRGARARGGADRRLRPRARARPLVPAGRASRARALRAAPPGIDPLDPRNLELEPRLPGRVVRPLGVDLDRPFCLQLLELDRWDDPHSTIESFRLARAEEPSLQLVLAATARFRGERGVAGGQGGVGLRRRHAGRGAAHLVRVARQPGARRAPAPGPGGAGALARRGLRPRPVRGALEAHAGRGRHRRRPAA